MKLIDRYLIRTFVTPLAYCLLAFCMVFIIFDLFDNIGDFLDAHTPFLTIARYYLVLLPAVLYRIVPIAVLLAVIYSLYNLSKNNELTALRASGISLHRMMIPFLAGGMIISASVLAVNETIGPDAAYWCYKFINEQRRDDPLTAHIARAVAFKKEKGNRYWYINTFDTRDFSMTGIEITRLSADSSNEESKIRADGGEWLDNAWVFTNVTIQAYDSDGAPRGAPEVFPMRVMSEYNERPQDFLSEVKDPNFLSSAELDRYIRVHRNLEKADAARYRTEYHSRLAWPWASLLVVMLGIPVGTHTGRKGVMPAIAFSLALLAGYLTLMFVGQFLGKNTLVPPLIGGWLPIITFFGVGTALLSRLR